MTIPSGSGTEVIKHLHSAGVDNATWRDLIGTQGSGTTSDHIYTIISIIVCERAGLSDALFELYLDPDAGGSDMAIADNVPVPSSGTFVWTDRFSITGTDKLHIKGKSAGGNADFNVWCTYIDQHI